MVMIFVQSPTLSPSVYHHMLLLSMLYSSMMTLGAPATLQAPSFVYRDD